MLRARQIDNSINRLMIKKNKKSGWIGVNGWELTYDDHRVNDKGEEEWYISDWEMWQTYDQLEAEFFKALEEEENSFLR